MILFFFLSWVANTQLDHWTNKAERLHSMFACSNFDWLIIKFIFRTHLGATKTQYASDSSDIFCDRHKCHEWSRLSMTGTNLVSISYWNDSEHPDRCRPDPGPQVGKTVHNVCWSVFDGILFFFFSWVSKTQPNDVNDCFHYHSWRINVVIAFGTLSSFLTWLQWVAFFAFFVLLQMMKNWKTFMSIYRC
jgi:hypothetical protein